jgi:hypothetical protein
MLFTVAIVMLVLVPVLLASNEYVNAYKRRTSAMEHYYMSIQQDSRGMLTVVDNISRSINQACQAYYSEKLTRAKIAEKEAREDAASHKVGRYDICLCSICVKAKLAKEKPHEYKRKPYTQTECLCGLSVNDPIHSAEGEEVRRRYVGPTGEHTIACMRGMFMGGDCSCGSAERERSK